MTTEEKSIGTADDVIDIINLIGRMFMTVLARLEREDMLHKVPSLGAVMSMYIELTTHLRELDVLQKEGKIPGAFDYDVSGLASYILAYAQKYAITLPGHENWGSSPRKCKRIKVPVPTMNMNDPWGFSKAFYVYRAAHSGGMAFHYCGFVGIGGDALDITTPSSRVRPEADYLV